MIDIHQHIVYGIDDGPKTMDETIEMLDRAEAQGIDTIIATAHAAPGFENFPLEKYQSNLLSINLYLQEKKSRLVLFPGVELFWSESVPEALLNGCVPTLASSYYVLTEFRYTASVSEILTGLRALYNAGFIPILAHAERYEALVKNWREIGTIREQVQARIQINCDTIIAPHGLKMSIFLRELLKNEWVDYVATDAHNVSSRPARMAECREILIKRYGKAAAARMTDLNQRQIFTS